MAAQQWVWLEIGRERNRVLSATPIELKPGGFISWDNKRNNGSWKYIWEEEVGRFYIEFSSGSTSRPKKQHILTQLTEAQAVLLDADLPIYASCPHFHDASVPHANKHIVLIQRIDLPPTFPFGQGQEHQQAHADAETDYNLV